MKYKAVYISYPRLRKIYVSIAEILPAVRQEWKKSTNMLEYLG